MISKKKKKEINDRFNKKIKSKESTLFQLAKQLKEGSKQDEVECHIEYNSPEWGKKTIVRLDLSEIVRIENMSEYEIKAIEQPGLFDKQNENYVLNIFSHFGIEVDSKLIKEWFIADNFEDMKERFNTTEEDFQRFKGMLFICPANHVDFQYEQDRIDMDYTIDDDDETWYGFSNLNPTDSSTEENSKYKIPENEDAS